MRFTAAGKEILKGARQAWKLEAAGRDDPKLTQRLRKIKLVEALRKAKKDWKAPMEFLANLKKGGSQSRMY